MSQTTITDKVKMKWIQYCHTNYYNSPSFSKTNAPSGNKNLVKIYFLECFVKICSSFKNTMESFSLYSNVFFPLICVYLLPSLRKKIIFSRRRISFLFCCYKLKYNFYPFQKTLVTISPQESHLTLVCQRIICLVSISPIKPPGRQKFRVYL